jgi:hypothetical protein
MVPESSLFALPNLNSIKFGLIKCNSKIEKHINYEAFNTCKILFSHIFANNYPFSLILEYG